MGWLWFGLYILLGIIATGIYDYMVEDDDVLFPMVVGLIWPIVLLGLITMLIIFLWKLLGKLIVRGVKLVIDNTGEFFGKIIKIRNTEVEDDE
jgi:hypothetical protein